MLAHRLRHRVTFQRPQNTQDPQTGDVITTWVPALMADGTPLIDVPAEVLTGPGKEYVGSGTVNAEVTARVNLRWFPGLDPSWRLLWDGDVFGILPPERDATGRREYRLQCIAGPSEGI